MTDVAGQPATSGSAVPAGRIAATDAQVAARLRAQGAVLIAKLATHEFGMVGADLNLPDPPARNPWNLAHTTDGSSSGSAVAVGGAGAPGAWHRFRRLDPCARRLLRLCRA